MSIIAKPSVAIIMWVAVIPFLFGIFAFGLCLFCGGLIPGLNVSRNWRCDQ